MKKPASCLPGPVYRLRGTLDDRERTIDLVTGEHRVGSLQDADVALPVPGVSRRHAVFTVTPGALVVEDLGSTNGTLVNGTRVERSGVAVGSELRFGPVRLQVEAATPDDSELAIVLEGAPDDPRTPLSYLDPDEVTLDLGDESPAHSGLVFPAGYRPGTSPPMAGLYTRMRPLLKGDLPVLVSGETGVGKELVARTLHDSSDRRDRPFVAINCAAIPGDLLEAEMFGIGKGVATGVEARRGKFQLAEGGTLFLDEIAEMAPALQAKLLRALQEKEIHPLGGRPRAVDVRICAATNVDLDQYVERGALRPDLFYRLAGFILEVPPLRRCPEDVPALVEHFLRIFSAGAGIRVRGMTVAALRQLTSYSWPGNVRELEHQVRRLVYGTADGGVISTQHLSQRLRRRPPADPVTRLVAEMDTLELAPTVQALEDRLIREALRRAEGKKIEACRLLRLSRTGLDKKIKRLGIDVRSP